ncbi:MAG: histidinol-phosphate transaminase [Lentisphaeria bacterium]|nr:histidinol-phosphate transaminase [Lentisphaeria bacterium]
MKSYFRKEIDAIAGYTAGEQPKIANLIKLNTNENPYPPSPAVEAALREFDIARLRRYPDPFADELRDIFAADCNVKRENVIVGNGSDDLLTMCFRGFTSPEHPVAVFDPSYSLYPVLAEMQVAPVIKIALEGKDFTYPDDISCQTEKANLLVITRPNAPTGTVCPKSLVRKYCENFDGMVLIDEAYGDFADDNCMDLALEYDNVIVMRTFSKSCSMAGVRLGYAVSNSTVIEGLMKLKDSYNIDMLSQIVGKANYLDKEYRSKCISAIRRDRDQMREKLLKLGFEVPKSQSNFLFAAPPDGDGEAAFRYLRENAVLVRYFKGDVTGKYIRITIGTPDENRRVLELLNARYA